MAGPLVLCVAAHMLLIADASGTNLHSATRRLAANHSVVRKLRKEYRGTAWSSNMGKSSQILTHANERIYKDIRYAGAEGDTMLSHKESGICKVPKHAENVWGSFLGANKLICADDSENLREGLACETVCAKWYKVPFPSKVQCTCHQKSDVCVLQPVPADVGDSLKMIPYLRCRVSPIRVGSCCILFAIVAAAMFGLASEVKKRQHMMERERTTATAAAFSATAPKGIPALVAAIETASKADLEVVLSAMSEESRSKLLHALEGD